MKFYQNKKIEVVKINYGHSNRVQKLLPSVVGMRGIILNSSKIDHNAFKVKLENGTIVLLYKDEIRLI